MKISSILTLMEGQHLYTELVDRVALQHGLSERGKWKLWDRVAEAINDRALRSRDPASSLPVGPTDVVSPVVTVDDFNGWLRSVGSGHLAITWPPAEHSTTDGGDLDAMTRGKTRAEQSTTHMRNPDVPASADVSTMGIAKRLTPIERQDERLKIFRERGGQTRDGFGQRWKGVTAVASELGISRQALTEALEAAYRREKRREQAAYAFGNAGNLSR